MLLFIFESTHDALSAEQILEELDYTIRIIPTPRKFSESCGLSIRVEAANGEELKGTLLEQGISSCNYTTAVTKNGIVEYGDILQ